MLNPTDWAMNPVPPSYHQLAIPPLLSQKAHGWKKVIRRLPQQEACVSEQSCSSETLDAAEVRTESEQSLLLSSDVPCKSLLQDQSS